MDALKAMIGLARERLTQASRALPRLRPPAAKAASLSDHQRNIAAPAEAGENEEGAAEDGHKAAWFRRKGRDEAEDLARLGAKARHQARVEREEAQRSVADADQRLQAVLGRSQANAGRAESVTCWPPQRRDSDDQEMAPMSINLERKFDEAMFNIYR